MTQMALMANFRRIGGVVGLTVNAGLVVLAAFTSLFRTERGMLRDMVGEGEMIEISVDTPLGVCEARDAKGLYKKARAGGNQDPHRHRRPLRGVGAGGD